MPKGFTENEKIWIRARLLEQGGRQFSAYGLKKTNVGELAEAAGISKGAFYLFYESKEALFMDVVEEAERNYRREVLAVIEQPGPSPRARLLAVLRKAFGLWKTIPILQVFTRRDYEILAQRIPPQIIQEHLSSDQAFVDELIRRCREAGIPITAPAHDVNGLLHMLFFNALHEDDFGPGALSGGFAVLLELAAAFCLGEITLAEGSPPPIGIGPGESPVGAGLVPALVPPPDPSRAGTSPAPTDGAPDAPAGIVRDEL